MNETLGQLLDEATALAPGSGARQRLEDRVLDETQMVSFAQLATLCDVLAVRVALEVQAGGDADSAEGIVAHAGTISEALRTLHNFIQTTA